MSGRLSKMGYKPEERIKVKLEFMRMLVRMKLDPARMELLAGFFETYLKLNPEEEERYDRELGKLDRKEVNQIMQVTTSWREKGRAEGIREGIKEGIKKGMEEGIKEDIKEGIKEGKTKKALKTARAALKKGLA